MMTMMTFHKASELVQHYWTPFCPGPLCRESLGPDSESESEMSMSHHIFTSSKYEIGNYTNTKKIEIRKRGIKGSKIGNSRNKTEKI